MRAQNTDVRKAHARPMPTRREADGLGGERGGEEAERAAEDGGAHYLREVALHGLALRVDAEAKGNDDHAEEGHEQVARAQGAGALPGWGRLAGDGGA